MTGGLQRCANTLVGTEADADLLGMTPEPEARPAPASAQHAETIADLRIVSAKDSTEQFSSMSSLSVKCPAGQNEVLVSVGRISYERVSEVARDYIPDWLQRLVEDGRPPASFQHLEIIDTQRADTQQVGPKLAAIIWFQRQNATARWDCTIRTCQTDANKNNAGHYMSTDGATLRRLKGDQWQPTPTGSALHFTPRAPGPQGGEVKDYNVFRFCLTLTSPVVRLQYPAAGQQHLVKLVVQDKFMRRVHKELESCRERTSCAIQPSIYGEYHPMAAEVRGRTIEIEGPSIAVVVAGTMSVIDAATQPELARDNSTEIPGLSLEKAGVTIAIPNQKAGLVLGPEGCEHKRLLLQCDLDQLQFGPDAPSGDGERLLHAKGGRESIGALVSQVLNILGPSPSGYGARVATRVRKDLDDMQGGNNHGQCFAGSYKKQKKDHNKKQKERHTKSKKEKHEALLKRHAKAKALKKTTKAVMQRLEEDPSLATSILGGQGRGAPGGGSGGGSNSGLQIGPRGGGSAARGRGAPRGGGGFRGRGRGGKGRGRNGRGSNGRGRGNS